MTTLDEYLQILEDRYNSVDEYLQVVEDRYNSVDENSMYDEGYCDAIRIILRELRSLNPPSNVISSGSVVVVHKNT